MMSSPLAVTVKTSLRDPPLTLTVSFTPSPAVASAVSREIDDDFSHVRATQLADVDGVAAIARQDLDALDVVLVHDDVADIARQQHIVATGRERDDLVGARAIELVRVEAALAVDDIAAFTRIPLEAIVAAAHGNVVRAQAAIDEIRAGAADDAVVADLAEQVELDA